MTGIDKDLFALFDEDEEDACVFECDNANGTNAQKLAKKRAWDAKGPKNKSLQKVLAVDSDDEDADDEDDGEEEEAQRKSPKSAKKEAGKKRKRQKRVRSVVFKVDEPRLEQWLEKHPQFTNYDDGLDHASNGRELYDATGSDADVLASVIRIYNVVLSLHCNMPVDWRFVLPRTQQYGVTYSSKKFGALSMVHVDPKCKTRIFASGKIDCKGAQSVADAVRCVQFLIDVIAGCTAHDGSRPYEKLRCTQLSLQNMVGMIKLPCIVDLKLLARKPYVSFDRKLFNMAFINMSLKFPRRYAERSEKVLVSQRGFVVITGSRGRHCVREVYHDVVDDLANAARTLSAEAPREEALIARSTAAARRIRAMHANSNNVIFVKPLRIRDARQMRLSDDTDEDVQKRARPAEPSAPSAFHAMAKELEEASARQMVTLHSMTRQSASRADELRATIDAQVASIQTVTKFNTQPLSFVRGPLRTRIMSLEETKQTVRLRGMED